MVLGPGVNIILDEFTSRDLIQRRGVTLPQRRHDQLTVNSQASPQRVGLDLFRKFELFGVLPLAQLFGGALLVAALDLDPVFLYDEYGDLLGSEGEADVDRQRHLAAPIVVEEHGHAEPFARRAGSRRCPVAGRRDHGRPGRRHDGHGRRRGGPQRGRRSAVTGPLRAGVGMIRLAKVQRLRRQRRFDDQYAVRRQEGLEPGMIHLLRFLDFLLVFALRCYSMLILFHLRASYNDPLAVCRNPQSFRVKSKHVEAQFVTTPCVHTMSRFSIIIQNGAEKVDHHAVSERNLRKLLLNNGFIH